MERYIKKRIVGNERWWQYTSEHEGMTHTINYETYQEAKRDLKEDLDSDRLYRLAQMPLRINYWAPGAPPPRRPELNTLNRLEELIRALENGNYNASPATLAND